MPIGNKSFLKAIEIFTKFVCFAEYVLNSFQKEHMKNAQQYFHLVGGSASECDTIPGRQSMASGWLVDEKMMRQIANAVLFLPLLAIIICCSIFSVRPI